MDYKLMHPGKYIEACDLAGRHVTVTIESVVLHDLESEGVGDDKTSQKGPGKKERKGLISFVGKQIPARTVSECLAAMFGRDTDGWIGKRVTLKPATVEERGQFYGQPCIRIAGSPDIPRDITFELRLPKKRPRNVTLTKTLPSTAVAPSAQPSAPPVSQSPGDMNAPPPDSQWPAGRE